VTFLFNLRVGVSSPPGTLKSSRIILNFLTCATLETALVLIFSKHYYTNFWIFSF